jgi:dCMP deaminase
MQHQNKSSFKQSPNKWHVVECENCYIKIERRKKRKSLHVFCSHKCKSKGSHIWLKDVKKTSKSNVKTGYYLTNDGRKFHYDSSYELRRMKELDYVEKNVKNWERCQFSIPWIDEIGNSHNYHPDFFVTYNDKTVIEETKGRMSSDDILKMKAGILYAKEKGWSYSLIKYDNKPDYLVPKLETYTNSYGRFVRPSFETIFMTMTLTIATRSTCLRKKVAAVFTDKSMQRVLCFGYNGNVSGGPNECDSLEPGMCGCTHAEINALTKSVTSLEHSVLFVTLSPCLACAKVLVNRGVSRVIYHETYRNACGLELLRKYNIIVEKFDNLLEITC